MTGKVEKASIDLEPKKCERCNGCGKIASDGAAWTDWEALPPGADLAVRIGLVKPLTCPDCGGTGKV